VRSFDFHRISQTHSFSKLYPFKDSIILTLDDDTRSTSTITLDLSSGEQSSQEYPQQSLNSAAGRSIKSNSFISKNRLFQVKANKEELIFSVKELSKSESVVQEYRMQRNEPLTFGGPEINNWSETTTKNKVFFKELFRGGEYSPIANLSVSVSSAGNDLFCQVGGYGESERTVGHVTPSGIPIGGGYAYTVNTYFNTVLDQKTLAYSGTDASATTYGKVDRYRKIMSNRICLETMAHWKGRFIHGYYNIQLKSYFVDVY
ncbi:MAG: hypothetical protein WA960_13380, partial [Tunicatimonas sp.]